MFHSVGNTLQHYNTKAQKKKQLLQDVDQKWKAKIDLQPRIKFRKFGTFGSKSRDMASHEPREDKARIGMQ